MNHIDETDCPLQLGFTSVLFITIGIVGVGVALFLVFRYFGILDMHTTDIVITRDGTNYTQEEGIIDSITLGIFQFYINQIITNKHFHIYHI